MAAGGVRMSRNAPGCQVCARIKLPNKVKIYFDGTLEDIIRNQGGKLQTFYKYINVLMNNRGGAIVIHSSVQNILDSLDQKVDQKLGSMISDGSMFHDVFERYYFDSLHLVFRVKPSKSPKRPWSTFDFQSRTSCDKGLDVPTYTQMANFIEQLCKTANKTEDFPEDMDIQFTQGTQAFITRDYGREPFQEGLSIQAKAMRPQQNIPTVEQLVDYCWRQLRLREYITAFTKIQGGGVVYYGVFEHKDIVDEWVSAEPQCNTVVQLVNPPNGWEIWKKDGQNPPSVYFVAAPQDIKRKEIATGEFHTEAFELTEGDRVLFHRGILDKVVEDLKWAGWREPFNPVQVRFHAVSGARADHCVVEIKVSYYHGICFFDKEGPESYKSLQGTPASLVRVNTQDWIDAFKTGAGQKIQEMSWRNGVHIVVQ